MFKTVEANKLLFEQLDTTATIITPNRRLASTLYKLFQESQLLSEKKCWQTPDILPLDSWLERSFFHFISKEFNPTPYLLNDLQEQFLWENILFNSKENDQILQIAETATIVRSSWKLLKQWCINFTDSIFDSAEDYIVLQQWAKQFQSICLKEGWLDHASLPDYIVEKIRSKQISSPSHLILIGFTEIFPQLERLLLAHKENACPISYLELSVTDALDCCQIKLVDEENEIFSIAQWAKSTFDKHPNTMIGCVIPDLDKKRDRVMQIFSEVFLEKPDNSETQADSFNISAGKIFLQYPLIHAAIQLLTLNKKQISTETLSYILRTPFLGEAESERLKRASFDRFLKQKNINRIPISSIIKPENDTTLLAFIQYCPLFTKRLANFFSLIEKNNHTHSYSEWATFFNQLLSCLGWPGERSLNSEEYQIVEHWLNLLNHYTILDHISSPVNYHQALQALFNLTNATIYQPKTPDAPIQILGLLEAAGLPFDYLWIAGMDDTSWPPQPKPNPFIPKYLQREYSMPHATAERQLLYCQQLTQQFKRNAKKIIFSYAEIHEELKKQASPLIQDLREMTLDSLELTAFKKLSEKIFLVKNMEILLDEHGPIIKVDEKIHGGVNVIKQQALCPFKAFAEWRLHAHELENPLPGLKAKERGVILHKILEIIWDKLECHDNLIALEETQLSNLIENSIETAIDSLTHRNPKKSHYIRLEKKRLYKIVNEWLSIEKCRPPFKVMVNEKFTQIKINQLNLSIRIDRIDVLLNGSKLIIDYKTGKNNDVNNWFGLRPEEPQLPIYAMLDPKNTSGICFGQISPGEQCFKGVSHFSLDIKGIKKISEIKSESSSWADQLIQWNDILNRLGDDFYRGVAKVDPKESGKPCIWCALKPLCRVHEEVIQNDM